MRPNNRAMRKSSRRHLRSFDNGSDLTREPSFSEGEDGGEVGRLQIVELEDGGCEGRNERHVEKVGGDGCHDAKEQRDIANKSSRCCSKSTQLIEFLFCAIFLGLGVSAGIFVESNVIETIEPRNRPIPYQQLETGEYILNQAFNEVWNGETVSTGELILMAVLLPFFIQLVLSYATRNRDIHKTVCAYCAAIGLTILVTSSIKLYVGYLRPIFYDVCQPDEDFNQCLNDKSHALRAIRTSFPSGHASTAFCGLTLLSFYLERRFGVSKVRVWKVVDMGTTGEVILLDHTSPPGLPRVISIFCYIPMILALFVSSSRVVDNTHFPADIIGGSVLGAAIASWIHGIWFPSWPSVSEITSGSD